MAVSVIYIYFGPGGMCGRKGGAAHMQELWHDHNSHSVSVIDSGLFFGKVYFMVGVEVKAW